VNLPWLDEIQASLSQSLGEERLGHAPMIQGPAGLGKRELARWLAARILCLSPTNGQPCGECRSCQLLNSRSHPDFFLAEIPEDKTQLTVDVVRNFSRGLQLTPSIGPHRVGLIEEADQMNKNAANALLKTLEEPSPRSWLILVSDDPDSLPATVLSRCQKNVVRPPDTGFTRQWLAGQAPDARSDDIDLALDMAGSAPLKALSLLTGDGLAFGREVREVLLTTAGGQIPDGDVTETWATRADEAWHWLAYWCRCFMSKVLVDGHDDLGVAPGDLARLGQQALEGSALANSSIRADLLLGKWLLEWSFTAAKQR